MFEFIFDLILELDMFEFIMGVAEAIGVAMLEFDIVEFDIVELDIFELRMFAFVLSPPPQPPRTAAMKTVIVIPISLFISLIPLSFNFQVSQSESNRPLGFNS
jgi:hypothetical protein